VSARPRGPQQFPWVEDLYAPMVGHFTLYGVIEHDRPNHGRELLATAVVSLRVLAWLSQKDAAYMVFAQNRHP
jgi:hypothetical protein